MPRNEIGSSGAKPAKRRRPLPTVLRDRELAPFLAVAACERDRLVFLLGLYCGLRVSEITHLLIGDLDLSDDESAVYVAHGKGDKARYVPIPDRILPDLRAWVAGKRDGEWLFPSARAPATPIARSTVHRAVKAAAAAAGLTKNVHAHTMRHTFATRALDKTDNLVLVRDLLGHTDVKVTQIYTHLSTARLRRAIRDL